MKPPDLASFDHILINTSAGKDSQVALDEVYWMAEEAGVADRVTAVHADLGRVEWLGTAELAEKQARHYEVRFIKVRREQGDLLDQIEQRGMWPSNGCRYCTSDHKRAPIRRVLTQLTKETHDQLGTSPLWRDSHLRPDGSIRRRGLPQVRILNVMGHRSEESPARAKLKAYEFDEAASNGYREVWTWLPIHDWKVEHVWERIKQTQVPYHFAYDLGLPRLSCVFCIFSPRPALMLAGLHNRKLLDEYCRVEEKIGHKFRVKLPIVEIRNALDAGEVPDKVVDWVM